MLTGDAKDELLAEIDECLGTIGSEPNIDCLADRIEALVLVMLLKEGISREDLRLASVVMRASLV